MIKNLFQKTLQNKVISGITLAIIAVGAYFFFSSGSSAETRYILSPVEKGTVIVSVSGSGQVAASQQVDVKPKVSGTLTYVGVKAGQKVSSGQVLATIDSRDAQRAVRDAQISLESSQISLEKMRRDQVAGSKTSSDDLEQAYKDAYSKISSAFLDLPGIVEISRGILYDNNVAVGGCGNVCEYSNLIIQDLRMSFKSITNRSETDYATAKELYDPNFILYGDTRLDASPSSVALLLENSEKTATAIAQAIKSEQNMLNTLTDYINDEAAKKAQKGQIPQQVKTYQASLDESMATLNSILANLGNARRAIEQAEIALDDNKLTNPIDIRSQENTVAQRLASLQDAEENLANYSIRAPFAGTVAEIDVKRNDSVSASTILATILTDQSIAEVLLNEVDIARIKISQKATLTFDALEDISITGQVIEVDSLGTVSQGVVSYGVKIGFDTQDARIKPGMSVSVAIITDVKQNVLTVPNSAVKLQGDLQYVEMLNGESADSSNAQGATSSTPPRMQVVETGLADDTSTEIISGLTEGDQVVTRTVVSTSTTASTQQAPSLLQGGGGTRALRGATGGGTFTAPR